MHRGSETHQLDISYRLPEDSARIAPGDRAPDAPVIDANGNKLRLFDLFRGPHATLLAFGDSAAPVGPGVHIHRIVRPAASDPTIANAGFAEGSFTDGSFPGGAIAEGAFVAGMSANDAIAAGTVADGALAGSDFVVDLDGHAFAAYDAADGDQVFVRPDGYLGSIHRASDSAGQAARAVR
jgi:hypothetical protein